MRLKDPFSGSLVQNIHTMNKAIILFAGLFSILGFEKTQAQSIAPFTLNATGGSKKIGSIIYDYSIGEMTLVNTFYGSNVIVTQGLLQNDVSVPVNVSTTILSQNLQVYPNPASSIVNIKLNAPKTGILSYRLMDMTGKILITNSAEVSSNTLVQEVNIESFAMATYVLEVTFTGAGINETTNYKLEKIK